MSETKVYAILICFTVVLIDFILAGIRERKNRKDVEENRHDDEAENGKDVEQNGLLPCPFCGNRTAPIVIILYGGYGGHDRYAVECDPIGAGCGVATMWKNSKTDAIDAWNRRANFEKM